MLDIKCCGKKFTENSQFHPGNKMIVQRGEKKPYIQKNIKRESITGQTISFVYGCLSIHTDPKLFTDY